MRGAGTGRKADEGRGAGRASVALVKQGEGAYGLSGDLTFESVPGVWEEALHLVEREGELRLDLRAVARTDSAGLALLVECMRAASRANARIRFQHIPPQMLAIAKVSRIDRLLPQD